MAYEELWSKLNKETTGQTCCRTGMEYDAERNWFILPVLDWTLALDPAAQKIMAIERATCQLQDPPHFALQAATASYLLFAPKAATSLEWISPLELPAGDTFFRGPHGLPLEELQATFGESPARFRAAAQALGGVSLDYADVSFKFAVFPRLAVAVLLWAADDEFPARVRYLVDAAAARDFPLDGLLGLLGLLADRLICLDPGE